MHDIRESDAAADFVVEMLKAAMQVWPAFISGDERMFGGATARLAADRNAAFEFGVACIAVQSQALPNLLPPEQADRVKQGIRRFMGDDEQGEHAVARFDEYYAAWTKKPSDDTPSTLVSAPFANVASELHRQLLVESTTRFLDIAILADGVVRLGIGWWKTLLQTRQLLPE